MLVYRSNLRSSIDLDLRHTGHFCPWSHPSINLECLTTSDLQVTFHVSVYNRHRPQTLRVHVKPEPTVPSIVEDAFDFTTFQVTSALQIRVWSPCEPAGLIFLILRLFSVGAASTHRCDSSSTRPFSQEDRGSLVSPDPNTYSGDLDFRVDWAKVAATISGNTMVASAYT